MHFSDPSVARFHIRRLATLTFCTAGALASLGATAAAASAAIITVPAPCVVNANPFNGAAMPVTGSGFTAGDTIQLSSDKGGAFDNATADPNGAFAFTMTAPVLSKTGPAAGTFVLTATDTTDGVTTATVRFLVANLAVSAKPARAKLGKKVTFTFSGFTTGKQIYGHYLHRKKVVITERMGKATGPCGLLRTRAALFPRHARYQDYQIQYDDARHYSKTSIPRLIATLTTVTF